MTSIQFNPILFDTTKGKQYGAQVTAWFSNFCHDLIDGF
jgi:hypothetical protein